MSVDKTPLPADFEKQTKARYDKLTNAEVSYEQFLFRETEELQRLRAIEADRSLAYKPSIGTMTPCGNGTLEESLNLAEWQGAYGTLMSGGGINFATLTTGIVSGPISSGTAHQTWVAAGTDPNVGIPTTAHGSAGAVRIGNAVNGYGCELLSKTFVVTPALNTISFWYAIVMHNPVGHGSIQPFFQVRVTDAAGAIVPGAFDFGSGLDTVSADMTNPFFRSTTVGGQPVVYRDWSCAQIKLGSMIGQQVTVEFVTADCGAGGHWGYAYIDSFCGTCKGSPTGNLEYDCEASTHCGPGQICFAYTLPKTKDAAGNTITGTVKITLDVYQNGALLTQFTSPVLNSGTSYCFSIVPGTIPGINASLGGFDFVASGAFAIGTSSLGTISVGAPPDGVQPGLNNDYQVVCATCEDIEQSQNAALQKRCGAKLNLLPRVNCHCPDPRPLDGDCRCECKDVKFPDIEPCISVSWGDSKCECFETDDVEILCITVCNCYSNVTFRDLTIGRIRITDMLGNPVPVLPDGTSSVQVLPSGPICFGDIKPCKGKNQPGCVSRELVVYTRGAVGKDYRLSFEGVCFTVSRRFQSEQCFLVKLCQD